VVLLPLPTDLAMPALLAWLEEAHISAHKKAWPWLYIMSQ
jgi:hypothetical protein